MIEQRYSLNLSPYADEVYRGTRAPTVTLSQFDRNTRKLIFELHEADGDLYTIPENATAALFGTKPDGTSFAYEMTVEDSNNVSILLPQQASTVAGEYPAEVILYDSQSERLGSANFYFLVESSAADEAGMASETDIPIFTELVAEAAAHASAASGSATAATGSAEDAEESATAAAGSAQVAAQSEEMARGYSSSAQDAKEAAEASATLSQSWAVGGTNTRELEDYDNSRFYSQVARQAATKNGWVYFYIDESGYLHYRKTSNSDLQFYIEQGYLHVILGVEE